MIKYLGEVLKNKLRGTALLRLDFNTEDEWRMRAAIPTIKFLLRHADKVVILSHRGRPSFAQGFGRARPSFVKTADGKFNHSLIRANRRIRNFADKFSLRKDAVNLSGFLRKRVYFIPHFDFATIQKEIPALPRKSIVVLENLRFLPGEETNDANLAKQLAALGDFYVNDAFAVSHRRNASVAAITKFLPSYAGLELEREIKTLSEATKNPAHPFVVILGGGKVADKLGVVQNLERQADWFLTGGVAANTLAHLRGEKMDGSLREARPEILRKLKSLLRWPKMVLPVDYKREKGAIFDIGRKTAGLYAQKIRHAKTIVWSGPLGFIEKKKFSGGTLAVAKAIATNRQAFSVAGGGETVMFLKKHRLDKKFSFVSTGGGSMLEFLAGEKLPGIEALK